MNFIAPDKMKSQTLRYDFIFLNYTQFFLQNIWEFLNKLWGQISFFRLQSALRKFQTKAFCPLDGSLPFCYVAVITHNIYLL